MYLVWINPPINFTFSDDSVFVKKNLGGGHKFSEFACFLIFCSKTECWYSLEPPQPTSKNKKKKKCQNFSSENFHFYSRENHCILHCHVFVIWNRFSYGVRGKTLYNFCILRLQK